MPDQLDDWPRKFYRVPGGKPFLFYAVFGTFSEMPAASQKKYRSSGFHPGLQLSHYDQDEDPDVLDGFRQGYVWDELKRNNSALADAVHPRPQFEHLNVA